MIGPILRWIKGFVKPPKNARLDLGRRELLACGATGVGAAYLFHTHPLGRKRSYNPDLVRPPGVSRKRNSSPSAFAAVSA